MAAAEVAVDFAYLSTHLSVPETTLTTVASQPTPDLVAAVLQAAFRKAQDFDTLYADKLRVDIELENAVRGAEARCQTFKNTADKALKDVEQVRTQLQNEGMFELTARFLASTPETPSCPQDLTRAHSV